MPFLEVAHFLVTWEIDGYGQQHLTHPRDSRASAGCGMSAEAHGATGPNNQVEEEGGLALTLGTPPTFHSASLSSPACLSPLAADPTVCEYAVWISPSKSLLTLLLQHLLYFLQLSRFFFQGRGEDFCLQEASCGWPSPDPETSRGRGAPFCLPSPEVNLEHSDRRTGEAASSSAGGSCMID